MNYRHAFHAGNFADVVKHAILHRIVTHLRKKETPFRVIDTHAGAGLYDLTGAEATRSPEWRDGVAGILDTPLAEPADELIAGYLDAVRTRNSTGSLSAYPGSPALVQSWLRDHDRLIACELEPQAAAALQRNLRGDRRVKTIAIDGWTALSAYIPPKERRGLVLIDPPYEQPDEHARLADALSRALRKWPTGIFLVWYPLKDRKTTGFMHALRDDKIAALRAEFVVTAAPDSTRLHGSGQIIVNPPWPLAAELRVLLPALAQVLAPGVRNAVRITQIEGARPARSL